MTFAVRFVCLLFLGLVANCPFSNSNPLGDFERSISYPLSDFERSNSNALGDSSPSDGFEQSDLSSLELSELSDFQKTFTEIEQLYINSIRCPRNREGARCLKWRSDCLNCECYQREYYGNQEADGWLIPTSCEKKCAINFKEQGVCALHQGDDLYYQTFTPKERTVVSQTRCPRRESDGSRCLQWWSDCYHCGCYQRDEWGKEDDDGWVIPNTCTNTYKCDERDFERMRELGSCVRFEGDPSNTYKKRFTREEQEFLLEPYHCRFPREDNVPCREWRNRCYLCDCIESADGGSDGRLDPESCTKRDDNYYCRHEKDFSSKERCFRWANDIKFFKDLEKFFKPLNDNY